jgi:cytoskeletal protein CcmA (bactofilin family)
MSIFRRDAVSSSPAAAGGQPAAAASSSRRQVTHIAPGSRIQGEVSGATELSIEGQVEGEVRIDSTVTVGSGGLVTGPISAQVVRVGGRVVGDVQASDRVEVLPSGNLEGNIAAPRIVIAEGAFFKGRVEMKGEKERAVGQGAAKDAEPGKS